MAETVQVWADMGKQARLEAISKYHLNAVESELVAETGIDDIGKFGIIGKEIMHRYGNLPINPNTEKADMQNRLIAKIDHAKVHEKAKSYWDAMDYDQRKRCMIYSGFNDAAQLEKSYAELKPKIKSLIDNEIRAEIAKGLVKAHFEEQERLAKRNKWPVGHSRKIIVERPDDKKDGKKKFGDSEGRRRNLRQVYGDNAEAIWRDLEIETKRFLARNYGRGKGAGDSYLSIYNSVPSDEKDNFVAAILDAGSTTGEWSDKKSVDERKLDRDMERTKNIALAAYYANKAGLEMVVEDDGERKKFGTAGKRRAASEAWDELDSRDREMVIENALYGTDDDTKVAGSGVGGYSLAEALMWMQRNTSAEMEETDEVINDLYDNYRWDDD